MSASSPYPPMFSISHAVPPLIGFAVSGLSGAGIMLAQATPEAAVNPIAKAWMEGGFSLVFAVSTCYACFTLWKRLNQRDQEIAALNKEIREEKKAQNDKLIEALDRIHRER